MGELNLQKELELLKKDVENLKRCINGIMSKDVCELKMNNFAMILEHIDEKISKLESLFMDVLEELKQVSNVYMTKEDFYRTVIFISVLFSIINVIISWVIKFK
ncbi:MAG: hypothetical protein QXT86_09030 [Archaeoglobaceae archaeon]